MSQVYHRPEREVLLIAKALKPDLKLSDAREKDIDPEVELNRVSRLVALSDGAIVCALNACPEGADTRVFRVGDGALNPVPGLAELKKLWPAGERLLLAQDDALFLVGLTGEKNHLLDVHEGTGSVDVAWREDGIRVAAIVKPERTDGPSLFPSERDQDELRWYSPQTGWVVVAEIPSGGWSLSLSGDGRRCAWLEPVNVVPEEAMRGEFRACELPDGKVITLTEGAGKAWSIQMADDGSGVVYDANFQKTRLITTHTDLWWHPWGTDSPTRITSGGRNIDEYGWLDGQTLWVSYVDGVERVTEALGLDGTSRSLQIPALGEVAGKENDLVCESGGAERFPFLSVGQAEMEIPQPADFSDLSVRAIDWSASDGLPIRGVLYEAHDTPNGAPLIIRAHGGPAGEVQISRAEAVRHRYLLRAGYRILEPAFRGSLGFGDDFLGANIGCQGVKDLDDITTGIDTLVEMGIADTDRVGITGGSYGGYMTLRAAAVTDRFKTGVALYGFIDNRRMTLETGDFTYEDEYIGPVTWPMQEDMAHSDVFSHLHEIHCPLLMLHGDQDPICTLSQSKIVYRALEHRGIQTGLVVYPGEGHGFRKPEHRQDCARRTLAWFEEFLSV